MFVRDALGTAVMLFAGMLVGILAGALAFMATQQIAGGFACLRDRRTIAEKIAGLRKLSAGFDGALTETRARIDEMNKAI